MSHNTNTPTHNTNISADKPSTVETIKEKASAVIDKITGKHHTEGTHGHDHHHDNKDHHLGESAVPTTGTHTGPVGTHTGTTTAGTHTGPVGARTGTDTTGTHTGPMGTHTGAAHTGAVPSAAPTATHSTGAGITSGGNIAPPAATHGTHGTQGTHVLQGTQGTQGTQGMQGTQGTQGTHVPHGTGLAGAAATQPLSHQYNPPAGHAHDSTTTGGIQDKSITGTAQNNQGDLTSSFASSGADINSKIAQAANIGYNHPEKVDRAVHAAAVDLVGREPGDQAINAAAANVMMNNPDKADEFTKGVTSRLLGQPGDVNNLNSAQMKPTM